MTVNSEERGGKLINGVLAYRSQKLRFALRQTNLNEQRRVPCHGRRIVFFIFLCRFHTATSPWTIDENATRSIERDEVARASVVFREHKTMK